MLKMKYKALNLFMLLNVKITLLLLSNNNYNNYNYKNIQYF